MWIATSHNVIGGWQQAGNVIRLEAENKYENYNYYYYYQVGGRESLDVRDQRDVGRHTICRTCLPGPVVFCLKASSTRSLSLSLLSEGQVYQVFVSQSFF